MTRKKQFHALVRDDQEKYILEGLLAADAQDALERLTEQLRSDYGVDNTGETYYVQAWVIESESLDRYLAERKESWDDDSEGESWEDSDRRVDIIHDVHDASDDRMAVAPIPPPCVHPDGHDWVKLEDSFGSEGGLLIRERCSRCGLERLEDTRVSAPHGPAGYCVRITYNDSECRRQGEDEC